MDDEINKICLDKIKGMIFGGIIGDASEIMLILCKSIVDNKTYMKHNTIEHYIKWVNQNPTLVGNNLNDLNDLFKDIETVNEYQKLYKLKFMQPKNKWSQNNGALMRCSPLALLMELDYFVEDCKITNPHPVCIDTNITYLTAMSMALNNYSGKDIIAELLELPVVGDIKNIIFDIINNKKS